MNLVLGKILEENLNHPEIKELLKIKVVMKEKLVYHAMVSSEETYLQAQGISYHDVNLFDYIGRMLHQKSTGVEARIKRQELELKS